MIAIHDIPLPRPNPWWWNEANVFLGTLRVSLHAANGNNTNVHFDTSTRGWADYLFSPNDSSTFNAASAQDAYERIRAQLNTAVLTTENT